MPPKSTKKKAKKSVNVPQSAQELEQTLLMITRNDTEIIKQGTTILKAFLDMPQAMPPMIEQVAVSQNPSARQVACVLLRKRILKHWKKLGARIQDMIRQTLIARLNEEEVGSVHTALTALVTMIARRDLPMGKFTELLAWTEKAAKTESPLIHQVASLRILRSLIDAIPSCMNPHLPMLRSLFERYALSEDARLRHRAITGLSSVFSQYDTPEQRASIGPSIAPLLNILQFAASKFDEDSMATLCDMFGNLADEDFIDEHLTPMFSTINEILRHAEFNMNARDKAAYLIVETARNKPGRIVKLNLIQPTLELAFALLCEPYDDDVFATSESTAQRCGIEIFETFIEFLPRTQIFNFAMEYIQRFLGHENQHCRKGAMVLLAVIAEGCPDMLVELENGKTYPKIVETVCNLLLNDPHNIVRTASAVCLVQTAEHNSETFVTLHANVMPNLLLCLEKPNENQYVREKCCLAIDACCEYLGDAIIPYLDRLMTQLMHSLNSPQPESMVYAIGAIKSITISSGVHFLKYFDTVFDMLVQTLNISDNEYLPVRARATECLGHMAAAIGVANWGGKVEAIIPTIVAGMETDYFELRETSHTFLSTVIGTLGENVPAELLSGAISLALATLDSDEGVVVDEDDEGGNIQGFDESDPEDEEPQQHEEPGEEEYDEELGNLSLSFRVGALDEKIAALAALSSYFKNCPKLAFLHIQEALRSLNEVAGYPYGPLRQYAQSTFCSIIKGLSILFPFTFVKGNPIPPPEPIKDILNGLFGTFFDVISNDDHPETVANAIENVSVLITTFGMGVLPQSQEELEGFYQSLILLTEEKGLCQVSEENNDITAENGETVLDALTDFYGHMAQVMGDKFLPLFDVVFPHMVRYCVPERPDNFRSLVIGSIAECIEYIGEPAQKYTERLFALTSTLLQDPSIDVRRNTAYLAGSLALNAGKNAARFIPQTYELMKHMLILPADGSEQIMNRYYGAKDNVVSALCKFVYSNSEVMPVDVHMPTIISNIPLTADVLECRYVYPMIISFIKASPNTLSNYIPKFVEAIKQTIDNPLIPENTVIELNSFLQSVGSSA